MPPPRVDPAGTPTRRAVLRLAGRAALSVTALGLAACSAEDRQALREVDPGRVRLDEGVLEVPEPPPPSARELRRRAVRAGSTAALTAYAGAAGTVPPLRGRTGGQADLDAALAVHREHAEVLAGSVVGPAASSAATTAPTTGPTTDPAAGRAGTGAVVLPGQVLPTAPPGAGPTLAPAARPLAVLGAGTVTAVDAALAERAADDGRLDLALLHARVGAARAAQAAALAGADAGPPAAPPWPTTPAGPGVVEALQLLLAQEHRARWSSAVVLAWADGREDDARAAWEAHTVRTEVLADLLEALGADPVAALPTYPTDDAGRPVDGPVSAAALALRLADAVAAATAGVLAATLEEGDEGWVRAAVTALGEAERARWSWGGAPVPWPGG